jgi:Peptidase family C50
MILHEHDFSNTGLLSGNGQQSPHLSLDGSDIVFTGDNFSGCKGVLPQLSCDQRLDSTMLKLTKLTLSQIPDDQKADLERNAITVGCTNSTRCWSLYLRGLMELEEVKAKGDLKRLWKGEKDANDTKALSKARGFLEQALTYVGSSMTDLKRKVQRSLALALGPTVRSNTLALVASDLIHQSINEATSARSRHMGLDRVDLTSAKSAKNYPVDISEVKAGLPECFRFLAIVSCPTGELLLDMIDGSQEVKTCCIFPATAEHVADSLLRPLHELLASSYKQMDDSKAIDRQDTEAKRQWRRDRREMDKSFEHFMRISAEIFTSADLPKQCRNFLFAAPRSTPGNLSSRFDEVATDAASDILPETTCMILLLDEKLHKFPFESLHFFESKTICRLPSLLFAHEICKRNSREGNLLEIDRDCVTYILNPEGDLADTEERLLPALEGIGSKYWTAYVKEMPQFDALEKALCQKSSLLLYFGHGGGERIMTKEQLASLGRRPNGIQASVVLMGCSSGELKSPNQDSSSCCPRSIHFEPDGLILRYLLYGAPCVVGNLWDVTDRDIDIFTQSMLNSIFKDDMSIAQCLAVARPECKFRFLTGAAPVCYGLPVSICNSSSHG